MPPLPVTFFYPYPSDLEAVGEHGLDDWRFWSAEWRERRRAWSLRTFLQLQRAGHPVRISTDVPHEGVVVVGPEMEMRRALARRLGPRRRPLHVVAIRADLPRCAFADVEVVQNGWYDDGERFLHVPHWPQPGLRPRNPARGARVETLSFKGYGKNLHPDFFAPEWAAALRAHGLRQEQGTEGARHADASIPWHDYGETDLVVALRPDAPDAYYDKPASKLINAWRAGVPALLGPEHPFRELRRSPLDYVEVRSAREALEAALALRDDPARYRAIVENGRRRAEAFADDRLTERWAEVLFEHVPRALSRRADPVVGRAPALVRRAVHLTAAPPSRDERAFAARWTADLVRLHVNGRFRPWLGRTWAGRARRDLQRRLQGAA